MRKRHSRLFLRKVKKILRKRKKERELENAKKCPYFIERE